MTRKAISSTLSALAAVALVTGMVSSPASADERQQTILEPTLKSSQATVSGSTKTPKGLATKNGSKAGLGGPPTALVTTLQGDRLTRHKQAAPKGGQKTPKGLATKKGPRRSTTGIMMGDIVGALRGH